VSRMDDVLCSACHARIGSMRDFIGMSKGGCEVWQAWHRVLSILRQIPARVC
jgi:hypothetical protein